MAQTATAIHPSINSHMVLAPGTWELYLNQDGQVIYMNKLSESEAREPIVANSGAQRIVIEECEQN